MTINTGSNFTTIATDSGNAVRATSTTGFTIAGSGTVATSGSGSTVTITGSIPATSVSFFAYVNTQIDNVTGDNTVYTVVFDTEVFDTGADFSTVTGLFTVPANGLYSFSSSVTLLNIPGTFAVYSFIIDGTTQYRTGISPPVVLNSNLSGNIILSLTEGQTVGATVSSGTSTKTADVSGVSGSIILTWFCGHRIS